MRVLAFDPGAERAGWAVIEGGEDIDPKHIDSGVVKVRRHEGEPYQEYKLRLIESWTYQAPLLIVKFKPDIVVGEVQPAVGGGNYVGPQSELAKAQITTVFALTLERDIPVAQVAAVTVKSKIGGRSNATKVGVRNGVITLLPALEPKKRFWTKEFEEPDANAVGLTFLGYSNQR